MSDDTTFDYIIVGGGLCGCVVAARIKNCFPDRTVALIETGPDARKSPDILSPSRAFALAGTKYHYTNITTPQKHLNYRSIPLVTGRTLGGGSAVNYGAWTRGDRSGYDEWAATVGDERWSYNGMLPYFKRAETYPLLQDKINHGYEGPIQLSSGGRGYPLRDHVRDAMLAVGLPFNPDQNCGNPHGVSPLVESWHDGERSFAANTYDLNGVKLLMDSQVAKVIVRNKKVTGIRLVNNRTLHTRIETIVSCGAIRTPQLLMLSGIGRPDELARLAIPVQVESAEMGRNLHDHTSISLWFPLRTPEAGLAVGSDKFMANPKYFDGNPMDWFSNASAPQFEMRNAAKVDGQRSLREDDIEISCMYVATPTGPHPPPSVDGSLITLSICGLSTTSRGRVTLTSADPHDQPVVDPNYLGTEHDRAVLRAGVRLALKMMDSAAGKRFANSELPPSQSSTLNSNSSDDALDERIRACTASMGTVVDTECRVKGVEGLRVVDASVLPVSIGAHLQAVLYGVAERAAEMIVADTR
ncbi:hypothetical protein LTR87_017901 [Friedmanniomyces endolithicus]|nr:hypothetical protein LTR87_017901 [Friedmanniomyces endolithicus]